MPATATTYSPNYKYGDTNAVLVPLKSGVAVNVGDICYVDVADGHTLKPAMSFTWTTSLAVTDANFVQQFAGVSMQQYDGTTAGATAYGIQDSSLRCATSGVFDFPCASATFTAGQLVGVAQDGANLNLAGQTVVAVSAVNQAIGTVVQAYPNATTTVRVEIFAPYFSVTNARSAS